MAIQASHKRESKRQVLPYSWSALVRISIKTIASTVTNKVVRCFAIFNHFLIPANAKHLGVITYQNFFPIQTTETFTKKQAPYVELY